jgi:hypothetical protein
MRRARSLEEYREFVRQALLDVEDLRASIEFDEEFMGDAETFLDPLEATLRELHSSLAEGSYAFSAQDLPFMAIVNVTDIGLLPFKFQLLQINATHVLGLDDEDQTGQGPQG